MQPFEPQEDRGIMWAKMGARIRNFCESGVDGLIVSIPDASLLESIQFCLDLNIPVVSVNAGVEFSAQLGLLMHIGQSEFNAGYGAGQRLVQQGMKEGICLNHNPGNVALIDRCLR